MPGEDRGVRFGSGEDPDRELAAMVEYLRAHEPSIMAQLAHVEATPGHDPEVVRADALRAVADVWKYGLRRKPAYLAWRREREPGYRPPDDPDPNARENLTDMQRLDRLRARRQMAQAGERFQRLSPEQQRVARYVNKRLFDLFAVQSRLQQLGVDGDDQTRALAGALGEGLSVLADMITTAADGGALLAFKDDDSE